VGVLGALRRLLGIQVTIGELIVIALILGTPYLIVVSSGRARTPSICSTWPAPTSWCRIWARSCHGRCCSSPTSAWP